MGVPFRVNVASWRAEDFPSWVSEGVSLVWDVLYAEREHRQFADS